VGWVEAGPCEQCLVAGDQLGVSQRPRLVLYGHFHESPAERVVGAPATRQQVGELPVVHGRTTGDDADVVVRRTAEPPSAPVADPVADPHRQGGQEVRQPARIAPARVDEAVDVQREEPQAVPPVGPAHVGAQVGLVERRHRRHGGQAQDAERWTRNGVSWWITPSPTRSGSDLRPVCRRPGRYPLRTTIGSAVDFEEPRVVAEGGDLSVRIALPRHAASAVGATPGAALQPLIRGAGNG
jgi:hypothetical protein